MDNNITTTGTAASVPPAAITPSAALYPLPVSNIQNVQQTVPGDSRCAQHPLYSDGDLFFDALESQPWLPTPSGWPSFSALSALVRDAIYHQLHRLSHTTVATSLLRMMPADLSKLLAAALICSHQGKEALTLTGYMAGMELLNQLIHAAAGATSTAAVLSSLPGLLLVWLQRHHTSLSESLTDSCLVLLSSGLTLCAAADITQPDWLLTLHEQVIVPLEQLCADSGIATLVTTGITLIVGLYAMLRLSGIFAAKVPQANTLTHGAKIIQGLWTLADKSHDYQRLYNIRHRQQQTQSWYQKTHVKPWREYHTEKALSRAVLRCLPKAVLQQKEHASAHFIQAYQHTEQQILRHQLSVCPQGGKEIRPPASLPGTASAGDKMAMAAEAIIPATSASEGASVTMPLLVSGAVVASAVVSPPWWQGRMALSLAATGLTLATVTGIRHLRHAYRAVQSQSQTQEARNTNNVCLSMITAIQRFLRSDNTGATLAAELFTFLFDERNDLDITRADRLLDSLNITTFKSIDYHDMNDQLIIILSYLLSSENNLIPEEIDNIIIKLHTSYISTWYKFIVEKKNEKINRILNDLRKECAREYLSRGIHSRFGMKKITEFILSQIVPNLLFMERNGREHEQLISKNGYYLWNYIGKKLFINRDFRKDNITTALTEGFIDGFIISRLRSYANFNTTELVGELKEEYDAINRHSSEYHRNDIKLERLSIITMDDIIEKAFPGIDIYAKQDFDTLTLMLKNEGRLDNSTRILRNCENFRDLIRNLDDGFNTLYYHLPYKVPQQLRDYNAPEHGRPFSLKKYPTRAELYQQFDQSYQDMCDKHNELYRNIIEKAFFNLAEDDFNFIHSNDTCFSSIDIQVKRISYYRYFFFPKYFRLRPTIRQQILYNIRPHYEVGKIFIAENQKEQRFYAVNAEYSRSHLRQLPIWRLPISKTEDIATLKRNFLDENYIFTDQQPFFEVCEEVKEPNTTIHSHISRTSEFFFERYQYYKNQICESFQSPQKIIVSFKVRQLADKHDSSLEMLKKEVTDNRQKFLTFMKSSAQNITDVEHDNASGKLHKFITSLPLYNCYELARDYIFNQQDNTPPSILIPTLQALVCFGDIYGIRGFSHKINLLLKTIRKKYTARLLREQHLSRLAKKIDSALIRTAEKSYSDRLRAQLDTIRDEIGKIDDDISKLRTDIGLMIKEVAAIPASVAFPWLAVGTQKGYLSALFPWMVGTLKTGAKNLLHHNRKSRFGSPWQNPLGDKLLEHELYNLPEPVIINQTCTPGKISRDNTTLNVFNIFYNDKPVFQQLLFTALRHPDPQSVIDSAAEHHWTIPENHNQMAMFCFIALTIPTRSYTSMVLTMEDYYKKGDNDIKITEEALWLFYHDVLERPYIKPAVELQDAQHQLIKQASDIIGNTLQSTIQAIELNYLFMVQLFLMRENVASLVLAMNTPSARQAALSRWQRELTFNLEKFTLYATSHSAVQMKFHAAVVEQFAQFCQQVTERNPPAIILFSHNVETFLERREKYQLAHPGATPPDPYDYTANWLQIASNLAVLYQSYARIEYSAKVLADFPAEQWHDAAAQSAWLNAMQPWLLDEMKYENFQPALSDAGKNLAQYWQQRQVTAGSKLEIINHGVINPLFIDDVSRALTDSCQNYPRLYFCQVWLTDNGRWFTFLTNDYMPDSHVVRSRRQVESVPSAYPVSQPGPLALNETVALPLNKSQLWALESFLHFAAQPFHQRLYVYKQDALPVTELSQRDAAALISHLIDEQGNIRDYQVMILSRYFPALNVADNYPLLQLLSDIFQLTAPQAPGLYFFIFNQLQGRLNSPKNCLSLLLTKDFVAKESAYIYRQFSPQLKNSDTQTKQALRHYISATLQHLISFTPWLRDAESRLTAAPLHSFSSQLLCIGAIIAGQLRLSTTAGADLFNLAWGALHDAGLLSLRETAIRQLALISGNRPATGRRQEAADALQVLAASVKTAAELQQHLQRCLQYNQQLTGFLRQLAFAALTTEQRQQLNTMISASMQQQHQLLQQALLQLTAEETSQLSDALKNAELRVSWYIEWRNNQQYTRVAGLGFHSRQQHDLVLPLGEPQYIPLIFRQLSSSPSDNELTQLCFVATETPHSFAYPQQVTLSGNPSLIDPAGALLTWMQQKAAALCASLTQAENESAFAETKKALESWLSQHLFFYGHDDDDDYRFIAGQTQQLAAIANHPDIATWRPKNQTRAGDLSAASQFNQAIVRVMGTDTSWPGLTSALQETGQRYSPSPLSDLPANGFAGFWWDPVSRVCYLGWKQGTTRMLYTSLANNRNALYPLPDDVASAAIWSAINPSDLLSSELKALKNKVISPETFFDDSVPLAWHLTSAMSGAITLPAGTMPAITTSVVRVYLSNDAEEKCYFSPVTGDNAVLPVTATHLADGGWQLDFTPSAARVSPDLGFTLKTRPAGAASDREWSLTDHQRWQLAPASQASQLIIAGNFAPAAYLQWGDGTDDCASMTPASCVLQGSDGSMIFIFSEDHYRRINYRVLDPQGTLCVSPQIPASWPRNGTATSAQQFNAQLEAFISQLGPDYWPVLRTEEELHLRDELATMQQYRRSAFIAAEKAIGSLPFRAASHLQDIPELFDIIQHLRSSGRNFDNEMKAGTSLQDDEVTLSSLLSNPFGWREFDLFREDERKAVTRFLNLKILMLQKALTLLRQDQITDSLSASLQNAIQQTINAQKQAKAVIEFIKQRPVPPPEDNAVFRLQQQHFAQNNFYSYYQRQLHITRELFTQPWPYLRIDNWPDASRHDWQSALDQLHTLAAAARDDQAINRLLTLSTEQWQTTVIQQRVATWRQICDDALRYWQTARRAEEMVLLRPQTPAGEAQFIPAEHQWPIRLILGAGSGDPGGQQRAGIAPARELTVEQQEDLLLTPVGPTTYLTSAPRLAGTSSLPDNAQAFAARTRLLLSSPWALAEFSSPSFWLRLQNRIRQAIASEKESWTTQERDFYHAADTQRFLQEDAPEQLDKHHYGVFFRQLYHSDALVIRLVMTDAEMIFGLLCEQFAAQYPQRATEQIAAAWFLFQQIIGQHTEETRQQPLYLIGV